VRVKYLLYTGIWCSVIFGFTSFSIFTGNNTLFLMKKLFNLDYSTAEYLNSIIRKGAHVCIFGTLALLIFLLLRRMLLAWGLTTIYASVDEYHQYFVPGRSAKISDVFLDSLAAFLFLILFSYFRKKNKSKV
jgi:VanZ family protein